MPRETVQDKSLWEFADVSSHFIYSLGFQEFSSIRGSNVVVIAVAATSNGVQGRRQRSLALPFGRTGPAISQD